MVGQPARCPCCTKPFLVPSSPSRPAPAVAPPFAPPRRATSAEKPAAFTEAKQRPQPSATPRKTMPPPRNTQAVPADGYDTPAEPPRSSRTMFLGLLSAGIVVFLLAGLAGTAAFLFRDQLAALTGQGTPETPVAQADPQPTDKSVAQQPSKAETPDPVIQPEMPPQRNGDAPSETAPIDKAAQSAKRKHVLRQDERKRNRSRLRKPPSPRRLSRMRHLNPIGQPRSQRRHPIRPARRRPPRPIPRRRPRRPRWLCRYATA